VTQHLRCVLAGSGHSVIGPDAEVVDTPTEFGPARQSREKRDVVLVWCAVVDGLREGDRFGVNMSDGREAILMQPRIVGHDPVESIWKMLCHHKHLPSAGLTALEGGLFRRGAAEQTDQFLGRNRHDMGRAVGKVDFRTVVVVSPERVKGIGTGVPGVFGDDGKIAVQRLRTAVDRDDATKPAAAGLKIAAVPAGGRQTRLKLDLRRDICRDAAILGHVTLRRDHRCRGDARRGIRETGQIHRGHCLAGHRGGAGGCEIEGHDARNEYEEKSQHGLACLDDYGGNGSRFSEVPHLRSFCAA
jgi:hypothetical protein